MKHLFCHSGRLALETALHARPLLAFDFDGTLAPIVERPDDAHVPAALARRLDRLTQLRPLAIITGRSVADVMHRLGFVPRFIVGNHGAEVPGQKPTFDATPLDALRARIRASAAELRAVRIRVEDKRYSLALHYRRAPDPRQALARIEALRAGLDPALRFFAGKFVVNAVLEDAPDKGDAVLSLVQRASCDTAVFVGDDINDEAVFERAPPNWVTIRVGHDFEASCAAFYLEDHEEIAVLLERSLRVLEPM